MLNNDFIPIIKKSKLIVSVFNEKYIYKIWYLSAIEIIDTQVARRGRQYHRNPPPYKNRPTKKNRIYKIKTTPTHTTPPPHPTPHPNPTHPTPRHAQPPTRPTPPPNQAHPNQPREKKKIQLVKVVKINYKIKISKY